LQISLCQYNPAILAANRANTDIQFITDPYGCIHYIIDYLLKAERNLSITLKTVSEEVAKEESELKVQMRRVGKAFVENLEISIQEAGWDLLQMRLKHADRDVIFIQTQVEADRVGMLKPIQEIAQLKKEAAAKNRQLSKSELYMDNLIKRYSRRSRVNCLAPLALWDFGCQLEIKPSSKMSPEKQRERDQFEENRDDEQVDPDNIEADEEEDQAETVKPRREWIEQAGFKVRFLDPKHRKIRRGPRFSKKADPKTRQKHFESLLMGCVPFFSEAKLWEWFPDPEEGWYGLVDAAREGQEMCKDPGTGTWNLFPMVIMDTYNRYHGLGDDFMEQVKEFEERRAQAIRDGQEDPIVAPNIQLQEEIDQEAANLADNMNVAEHVAGDGDDDEPDSSRNENFDHLAAKRVLIPGDDLIELVRQLNPEQRKIYDHVMHSIKTRPDEPLHELITGAAGTGKSLLIKAILQSAVRFYKSHSHAYEEFTADREGDIIHCLVMAPTGKAAFNVKGMTLHSGLGIPLMQSSG